MGDATWHYSSYNKTTWMAGLANESLLGGGYFGAFVTASNVVSTCGYYEWTSPVMLDEVLDWSSNEASNRGWIFIADGDLDNEKLNQSLGVKIFSGQDAIGTDQELQLIVEYTTELSAWIIVAAAASILLLLILVVVGYIRFRRSRQHATSNPTLNKIVAQLGDDADPAKLINERTVLLTRNPNMADLENLPTVPFIEASEIQLVKLMGSGGFANVYRGVWTSHKPKPLDIAVKKLRFHVATNSADYDEKTVKSFLQEILMLSTLDHPNVLSLLAVSRAPDEEIMLVMELCRGSLDRFIYPNSMGVLPAAPLSPPSSPPPPTRSSIIAAGKALLQGKSLNGDPDERTLLISNNNENSEQEEEEEEEDSGEPVTFVAISPESKQPKELVAMSNSFNGRSKQQRLSFNKQQQPQQKDNITTENNSKQTSAINAFHQKSQSKPIVKKSPNSSTLPWELSSDARHWRWQRVMKILIDVAYGIHYLHSVTPSIIHRDLKPQNILISMKGIAKISDFGLSKVFFQSKPLSLGGTAQYISPESIRDGKYSEKSDVYAFGIVMNELISLQRPFHNQKNAVLVMYEVVNSSLRPPVHPSTPVILSDLIKRCWATEPADRPSIKEVIDVLTSPDLAESHFTWPFTS